MRGPARPTRHSLVTLLTLLVMLAFDLRPALIGLLVAVAIVIATFPFVLPGARAGWRFGLWATAGVLGLALIIVNATRPTAPPQPGPPIVVQSIADAGGRLIWAADNTLEGLTLSSGQEKGIVTLAKTGLVTDVALSPQVGTYALSYAPDITPAQQANSELSSMDLYLLTENDAAPRLLLDHTTAGGGIAHPSWSADGQYVFVTVTDEQAGGSRIVRVSIEDGTVVKIADQASDASCSPDGRTLVYVRRQADGEYAEIWRANLDGSKAEAIRGARFSDIVSPVISPDGELVAFSAPFTPTARGSTGLSIPLFHPETASAHGGNWEVFTVPIGGGAAEVHTAIGENRPRVVWSPSGDRLAVNADLGIYVVDVRQNRTDLFDLDSGSGLVWAK